MFNMEKQFCNNCGNFGHVYGNCRHPILSYGIILFNINDNDKSLIGFKGFFWWVRLIVNQTLQI